MIVDLRNRKTAAGTPADGGARHEKLDGTGYPGELVRLFKEHEVYRALSAFGNGGNG